MKPIKLKELIATAKDPATQQIAIAENYTLYWCCTIKVDIENSKGQYIEKDKQEATKDGKMIFYILPPRKRANSNAYT